jgi:hypothetical protein
MLSSSYTFLEVKEMCDSISHMVLSYVLGSLLFCDM